jgi:hypothetical protein
MNTQFNNELSPKNKPYDEEVLFEEATSEDLEIVSVVKKDIDDAYDAAFTNLITEQLKNPKFISNEFNCKINKNEVFTFRPPTPPKNNSEGQLDSNEQSSYKNSLDIGDGKFEYVIDKWDREMFVNAWQAISQTNLWDFIAQDIESFLWSNDIRIKIIGEKMEQLGYSEHSGCSFGITLRHMQYLAQRGNDTFKKLFDVKYNTENVAKSEESSDKELDPYPDEDAMEHEERLKKLIKRRIEKAKIEDRLLEYMGGY